MSKQALITIETKNAVPDLLQARRRSELRLFIVLFITLLGLTPLLTELAINIGVSVLLGVVGALVLALVIMRWPIVGLFGLTASALLVEQDPLPTPVLTDRLYVFHWPAQLEGLFERPIGMVVLLALFVWVLGRLLRRQPLLRGGALWFPLLLYILCVVGGAVYGLATGGNLKIIVVEVRPFWYTFTSYVLAYNFITQRSHVRNLFWLVIGSAGVKSLQGVYIYFVVYHHKMADKSTIMSHEESFFFVSLLLLVLIFSLYYRYRPQFIAALCITPPVIISMVANQRRTDYIALLVGLGVAWVLIYKINPPARKRLLATLLITLTLGTAYILAFQNNKGTFGQPARSIMSIIRPNAASAAEASSNLYRVYENNDLIYTAKHYPLGVGFGKPFLQPQLLTSIFPQILTVDQYYNYIPHNTIYWIWADLGPIGYFALWFFFGSTVIFGSLIVRKLHDPYLQVIAIYIVAITIMEVIVAFADYQLFFYRNVIYQGVLCGILAKLPILDQEDQPQQKEAHNERTHGVTAPSKSLVGSRNT